MRLADTGTGVPSCWANRLTRSSSSIQRTSSRAAVRAASGARPAVRAPELAASFGRETLPFKIDVRKLKELGLTESLPVGYRLSPRGRAVLDRLDVAGGG